MTDPDPAIATTCDRLAARLPHLSTQQLAQVAVDLVNGVDEARGTLTLLQQACDEIEALRAATEAGTVPYDRDTLVTVLIGHRRTDIRGCRCGWAMPGRSQPEHVADIYEQEAQQ